MHILVASIPEPQRAAWQKHQVSGFKDKDGFEQELVRHVETTLARSMFNCDESAAYSATSLAFRDRLILEWNRTQQRQTYADSKRVYYLSLEFLMGRALDNAMLNIGSKDVAKGKATWPVILPVARPWSKVMCSVHILVVRESEWLFKTDIAVNQPVSPSWGSGSRISSNKSMMLPLVTVASDAWPRASSTVSHL